MCSAPGGALCLTQVEQILEEGAQQSHPRVHLHGKQGVQHVRESWAA